jgi:putative membrane protein
MRASKSGIRRLRRALLADDGNITRTRASIGVSIAKWLAGAALLAYLLRTFGEPSIGSAILRTYWALPPIFVLHLVQLALSGYAWRVLLPSTATWAVFFRIRLIREGVAGLLPIGPVSAAAVGMRLLVRRNITAARAAASLAVDLTAEMAAQIVFLLWGIALLPADSMTRQSLTWITLVLLIAVGMCAAFVIVQRIGMFRLFDFGLARLATRWPSLRSGQAPNFHESLVTLHRNPDRILTSVLFHSASWVLGSGEVWLALHALHHTVSFRSAFIMESIGTAIRNAGFAIPGALGVQEAGFVLAGSLVGISADVAISLSLIKRIREFLVAGSGLFLWRWENLAAPREHKRS